MRFLYYKHPPLVKPLPKAPKPCRPLQALCCLAPSGAFFLRVESLKISLPREETTERKARSTDPRHRGALHLWAGFSTSSFFHSKRSPAMKPCSTLHPVIARRLGIQHMMYAPPLRPAHRVFRPVRPLVVRCTPRFAGAILYCSDLRIGLRRRFIMENAQTLSGFALIIPFSLLVGKLINDTRWYLISILLQCCIIIGLVNTGFCRPLYRRLADWWMRRIPNA